MTLEIPVCEACGRAVFPVRREPVDSGVLEAAAQRGEVRVGAVRTSLGPLVIARVVGDAQPGDEVPLSADGTVPVAGV